MTKGPLVNCCIEGMKILPKLYRDYFISHEIRIPIKPTRWCCCISWQLPTWAPHHALGGCGVAWLTKPEMRRKWGNPWIEKIHARYANVLYFHCNAQDFNYDDGD